MKRILGVFLLALAVCTQVYAVAEVPKSSVWFDPSDVAAGESIFLNALVYNNQSTDATVTVVFSTPAGTVDTASTAIAKATAKTLSVAWKMPKENTVVTAKITTATNPAKKSLPALVGTIGTVTVGPTAAPAEAKPFSFSGSKQLAAWFGPLVTKIDAWRIQQHKAFVKLKTDTQNKIDSVEITADDKNSASKALGSPLDTVTLMYATAGSTLFASQALFYIAAILLILMLLRAIVNRFV